MGVFILPFFRLHSSFADELPADRIFLITIDTLRADHLGSYGYPRKTSPFLDLLASNGVLFENAFASTSATTPSHASIFTTLYPIQHKVLRNGYRLDDSFYTIAEFLKENGYLTGAVVSTDYHFIASNLHQGFDYFNEPQTNQEFRYRSAEESVNKSIKYLESMPKKGKLFFWLHVFDPHHPYLSRSSYLDAIGRGINDQALTEFLLQKQRIGLSVYGSSRKEMLNIVSRYDAEIRYVDAQIERLYKHVKELGLNSRALWIITSDHGEGLGNHNTLRHGNQIYNEQLKAPLIFYSADRKFKNQRVSELVELIDIFPTVISLIKDRQNRFGTEIQGSSLLPLLQSSLPMSESNRYAFGHRTKMKEEFKGAEDYRPGEEFSLQNLNFKYIYRTEGKDEFFSLRNDPYETKNLMNEDIPEKDFFRELLLKKSNQFQKDRKIHPKTVDPETIEKLQSLGYIQ